jgi:hypothetical protein
MIYLKENNGKRLNKSVAKLKQKYYYLIKERYI